MFQVLFINKYQYHGLKKPLSNKLSNNNFWCFYRVHAA